MGKRSSANLNKATRDIVLLKQKRDALARAIEKLKKERNAQNETRKA